MAMRCNGVFKKFTWRDLFRVYIVATFFAAAVLTRANDIPETEEDLLLRRNILISIMLSSSCLSSLLIVSEYGFRLRYIGSHGKKNTYAIILNIATIPCAITLLISSTILLILLNNVAHPNITEEIEKCQEYEVKLNKTKIEATEICRGQYSGDNYLRICDLIFENTKILRKLSSGGSIYAFPQGKYCVRSIEYRIELAAVICSLVGIFFYPILQIIVVKEIIKNDSFQPGNVVAPTSNEIFPAHENAVTA